MKYLSHNFSPSFRYLQQKKTLLIISISIIVLISLSFMYASPLLYHRGVQTKQAVVTIYLHALTRKDSHAIQQLIPTYYESNEAIQQKLEQYGGSTFKNITTQY